MSTEKEIQFIQSRLSELEIKLREAEILRGKMHQQRQDLELKLEMSDLNRGFLSDQAHIVSIKEFAEIRKHAMVKKYQLTEIAKELAKLDGLIEKQKQLIENTKNEIVQKKEMVANNVIPFRKRRRG